MQDHLTYQWLTPVLISLIGFSVAIIGIMIRGYLSSIEKSVNDVGDHLEKHISKVEVFILNINEKYYSADKRLSIVENFIDSTCPDCKHEKNQLA